MKLQILQIIISVKHERSEEVKGPAAPMFQLKSFHSFKQTLERSTLKHLVFLGLNINCFNNS